MAEERTIIGTQVAVDLDNGAALGGVVAAAQRALISSPRPFIISTALLETLQLSCGWDGASSPGLHNPNQPFQYRANHIPIHGRCPDCLNPGVVMNQESTRPIWRHKRTPNPLSSIPQKVQSL